MGMVRLAADGEAKPILQKGGKPKIFPEEVDALRAILRHVVSYMNGHFVRDGEVAGRAKLEADALFPKLVKQKGRSRAIRVEKRKGTGRGK